MGTVRDCEADLRALIETEIPEGKQNLESSCSNLERLAAYCEHNYFQANDKSVAFEETQRFTIQSLASVAYQINTLASSLLQMVDRQADKMAAIESHVSNIAHMVDVHKEKLARREIGVLTVGKINVRQHRIQPPSVEERAQRYHRTPIDYTVLDGLGHGVVAPGVTQPVQLYPPNSIERPRVMRTNSAVSAGSSGSGGSAQPTLMHHHLLHQQQQMAGGHFPIGPAAGGAGPFPPRYMQMAMGQRSATREYNNKPPPMMTGNSAGSYAPLVVDAGGHMSSNAIQNDDVPPPPSPSMFDYMEQHSPPLPPPPPMAAIESTNYGLDSVSTQPPSGYRSSYAAEPEWAPRNYLDKVVAIYDYQAQKPDELSFQENDLIYVLKRNDDGWFEGVLEGVTGLFPGNYVDSCLN